MTQCRSPSYLQWILFYHLEDPCHYFTKMRWGTSQPLFIEVPAASQETQRSCICVLGVSILLLFWRFFLLEFGTVSTVCYCLLVMLFSLFINESLSLILNPNIDLNCIPWAMTQGPVTHDPNTNIYYYLLYQEL